MLIVWGSWNSSCLDILSVITRFMELSRPNNAVIVLRLRLWIFTQKLHTLLMKLNLNFCSFSFVSWYHITRCWKGSRSTSVKISFLSNWDNVRVCSPGQCPGAKALWLCCHHSRIGRIWVYYVAFMQMTLNSWLSLTKKKNLLLEWAIRNILCNEQT